LVSAALSQVRGAQSTAQVSMRTEISRAVLRGSPADLEQITSARDDLSGAGRILTLDFEPTEGADLSVDVTM
jgi:valyl-tRNA synthetase